MMRCTVCAGALEHALYWSAVVWSTRDHVALPGFQCVSCGSIAPDPDGAMRFAEDLPDDVLVRCLARRTIHSRPSVMVVDDEQGVRKTVSRALAPMGISVHEACDGHEALERLSSLHTLGRPPQLVLVDVVKHRMSGVAFVAHARRIFPWLVLVVMSGDGDTVPYADGALPKPVHLAGVVSVVRELLTAVPR